MKTHTGPVGLISNPGSGHNRKKFEGIRTRIGQCPQIHHIVTNSPADVKPALTELAGLGISVLAINGGDGTASCVLGELLESGLFATPPLIALLPGGTANMNAGDIGIRGSLRKATSHFCNWCESGRDTTDKVAQRVLLRVVTEHGQRPHYGMFLGGGAIIQGTEYAHREIHSRGFRDGLSLALSTLRTVWGVLRNDPVYNRHVAVNLFLDDAEPVQHNTLILAMSTLHRLAFGMHPFWGREQGDIRLTLIEQQCTRFARTFFSIVRGRPSGNAVPSSGYISHNAQKIRIELDGKLNLDGEILVAKGPVEISASIPLEFLKL
ncbi:MAG: kinase [Gammaproteobacteria bacterium]|nr:MAG: kinase [Gammaproteobacteria bacterium]RLA62175.1 MAG: kinase [Gammaproteobacteria bacterium]